MIGGVASGLAAYFNIAVWIPRLVFAFPLVIGVLNKVFSRIFWWDNDWGFPHFVFNGFGGTLFLTYIILWIVIPEAKTASEKLEMRGEKVDLESIKNSVQEELKDVKVRAEKFGTEFSKKAESWGEEVKDWGKEASDRSQQFVSEVAPAARNAGNGIGHVIGVLFKAFFLFIAGIIVFALFIALMSILFSGGMVYGLKDYVLSGFWQNLMAFNTIALLLGVPIIAAVVWLIRRISGARSNNSYLGWTFGSLWTIGLISAIILMAQITRQFKRVESSREDVQVQNPSGGRMLVNVKPVDGKYYNMVWFDDDEFNNDKFPALTADEDSMLLNTVRVKVVASNDSSYHTYLMKFARGNDPVAAESNAERISFPIEQRDSLLLLPAGFAISKETKFRNQQVLVIIEVQLASRSGLITIPIGTTGSMLAPGIAVATGLVIDWDDSRNFDYSTDVWYTMTSTGLQRNDGGTDWNSDDNRKDEETPSTEGDNNGGYRYRGDRNIKIDSAEIKLKGEDTTINIKLNTSVLPSSPDDEDLSEAEAGTVAKASTKLKAYDRLISVFNLMKL